MKHTFQDITLNKLPQIAEEIIELYKDDRIFAFFGKMGAGKTTLIKEICNYLKVEDIVCSPTFAIVNEYHTIDDESIFHFDFYRLKSIKEAFDIGYEDYFFSGNYCFIEWSEKITELLPQNFVKIQIDENEDDARRSIISEKF
ncbi:MAG: tRNA (adenosine(37)-N6)-threonylcarbamoyltransferase complex ATPase subunit type 1 TsaE [Bacteroidales bacterium]